MNAKTVRNKRNWRSRRNGQNARLEAVFGSLTSVALCTLRALSDVHACIRLSQKDCWHGIFCKTNEGNFAKLWLSMWVRPTVKLLNYEGQDHWQVGCGKNGVIFWTAWVWTTIAFGYLINVLNDTLESRRSRNQSQGRDKKIKYLRECCGGRTGF